ncbi:MAG: O-antigen ligase family protein [Patescibacteria group bacterium]
MNILKKIIQALLYISLATPLIFYHYFFYPFITTKALFFRVIILLIVLLFLIYLFIKKKISYKTTPLWWSFLILVIVYFLSAIFGMAFGHSFWSNIERATGVIFFIHLFIYFAALVFAFKEKKQWQWLFRTSLFVSLIAVVYGLMQHFGLADAINTTGLRISSTLGNPAYFGSYLLINIFLAVYLFVSDRNILWKIFYTLSGILSVWTLFLTQTRGALVGLVGALILLALLNIFRIKKEQRVIKRISAIFLILIILFSVLIFVFKDSKLISQNDTLGRVVSISLNDYTTQTRLAAWSTSFEAWQEKPIFGWGLENYGYAFSKYFPSEIYTDSGSRIWFDNAHSVFFEHLVSTGLLGVLSYFAIFFLAFLCLFKTKRISRLESNIFIALLAGYIFANLFVFDTINTYILIALILAFINNRVIDKEEKEFNFNYLKFGILIIFSIFLVFVGYKLNIESIEQNKYLLEAEAYARENDIVTANSLYIKALENNSNIHTVLEVRRHFAIFVRNDANKLSNYEAAPMFDRAIEEMQKSIDEDPNEIRHYYNLSQLYLTSYKTNLSRLDKVIEMKDKMIDIAPQRAHTYYQIGEAYVLKKDYANALENFQKAVEINPDVVDTHINVMAIAILTNDLELEKQEKEAILRIKSDFFDKEKGLVRFIPLYKRMDRREQFVADLEKLIQLYPEKIEYFSTLAIFYAEIGENQKSEQTIKLLLGRSQELDKQVESFVNKIYTGEFLVK